MGHSPTEGAAPPKQKPAPLQPQTHGQHPRAPQRDPSALPTGARGLRGGRKEASNSSSQKEEARNRSRAEEEEAALGKTGGFQAGLLPPEPDTELAASRRGAARPKLPAGVSRLSHKSQKNHKKATKRQEKSHNKPRKDKKKSQETPWYSLHPLNPELLALAAVPAAAGLQRGPGAGTREAKSRARTCWSLKVMRGREAGGYLLENRRCFSSPRAFPRLLSPGRKQRKRRPLPSPSAQLPSAVKNEQLHEETGKIRASASCPRPQATRTRWAKTGFFTKKKKKNREQKPRSCCSGPPRLAKAPK